MAAFPIGFWNYVDIADQHIADVNDWADAGMTLTMGPYYTSAASDVARMRAILDAAANIARALKARGSEPALSLALPEANSLGQRQ